MSSRGNRRRGAGGLHRALVIFAVFAGGSAVLVAGAAASDDASAPTSIRLIFGDPRAAAAPADRCLVETCRSLVRLIDDARTSVDFALYGMRRQTAILQALQRAQERGVAIRGVIDRDATGKNHYSDTEAWVAAIGSVRDDQGTEDRLNATGLVRESRGGNCPRPEGFEGPLQCMAFDVGTRWLLARHASTEDFTSDDQGRGGPNRIMHDKFFVVDGRWVWTGSANISDTDSGGYNANLTALIASPVVAEAYRREFEQMWTGRFHAEKRPLGSMSTWVGDALVSVSFSPQADSMRSVVEPLLESAQREIDVAVFYLTDKWAAADLIAAHRRGVRVRVIIDATSAENGYTKHELLRAVGIPVKVENWGGKMHMKSAVIDGRWVIGGSMNWTAAGTQTNDENTLVIQSSRLAREYRHFYDQLWSSIPERWLFAGSRPAPESLDSSPACADGIDNDFDLLIDLRAPAGKQRDPGCLPDGAPRPLLPPHEYSTRVPEGYRIITGGPQGATSPAAPWALRLGSPKSAGERCDPAYRGVCIPPPPPDLDCKDIKPRSFRVLAPDPHRLDGNHDGVGCTP